MEMSRGTGPSIHGSLAVNGNANFGNSGGQIDGTVDVVGTYTRPANGFPPNQSPPTVTPLPFNFASVKTSLQGESNYLASLAPNGTTTFNYRAAPQWARGVTSGFYIFDVTGAQLAAATHFGLTITAPSGSTVLVNVDGTNDSFFSMGITLNGVDNQHVLYNFSQATNLLVDQIGVEGTILAPNANVNFAGGQINGSIIAQSITGQGESHLHLFTGNLPTNPIPEPSTFVLAACGLAASRAHGLIVLVVERSRVSVGISLVQRKGVAHARDTLFYCILRIPLPHHGSRSTIINSKGIWVTRSFR